MTVLGAILGAGIAAGVLLVVTGWSGSPAVTSVSSPHRRMGLRRRCLVALLAGAGVAVVTRWPAVAIGAIALGWFHEELLGSRAAHANAVARTEAIASWTEMLRDTISGAHGIEEAVITTAAVAPPAIREEVVRLALRAEREPLDRCLQGFGADLAHPTADLVVTSLSLASRGATGDLVELLGTLAVAARDEAAMRLRVDAARARLRTAVRVIAGVTLGMAAGLIVLNRGYIDVYRTAGGQVVIAVVVCLWAGALAWLSRAGEFIAPERFLAVDATRADQ
jgi:hypothetical protein